MVVAAASMVMDKCTEFYPVEGGNLLGGEGGRAWSIGGGGSLLLWGGGRGMAGLMKSFPLEEGKDLLTMGKKQNERCNNSAVHGWVEGSRSLLQISKKYNQTLPQP